MGLNCSHNAWDGSYSSFHHFRKAIAAACGVELSDFWTVPPNTGTCPAEHVRGALAIMNHSDCDGDISPEGCVHVAAFLRWAIPHLPEGDHWDNWPKRAEQFAQGCDLAAKHDEPLRFD